MSILIKNARVIDYKIDELLDILIEGDRIKWIGEKIDTKAEQIIDGSGKVVMPGFVDLHAHFRDPGFLDKEDLMTGQKSALNGGYTTVNLMGNTKPVCSSNSIYHDIMQRAKEIDLISIYQVMSVTKDLNGEELLDFHTLPKDLKFLSDDGKGILSNRLMYEAMKQAKKRNIGIMIHAEDPTISGEDYRLAEDIITIRDVYLSGKTKCRTHFSHVSTIDSLEAIRSGKEKGYPVTCEVTPHHISMWDSDYRVNPPIRDKNDVKYIIESIFDGTVDAIATDHAPHTKEDKKNGAPGMIGLESSFFIVYKTLCLEHGASLKLLSNIMSHNPAQILQIKTGQITPGYYADLVMIDFNKKTKFTEDYIQSKSKNSPFLNQLYDGAIDMVMSKGKVKLERK